jgi:hypothetical protein
MERDRKGDIGVEPEGGETEQGNLEALGWGNI